MTSAGERLLPHALDILNSVTQAKSIAQELEKISGKLRIGTCESYVISMLPPVIMEFSEICPSVEISTHTALVPDLFNMLRQNDVDILYFLDEKIYFPEWIKLLEQPENIFFRSFCRFEISQPKENSNRTVVAGAPVSYRKGNQLPICFGTILSLQGI